MSADGWGRETLLSPDAVGIVEIRGTKVPAMGATEIVADQEGFALARTGLDGDGALSVPQCSVMLPFSRH